MNAGIGLKARHYREVLETRPQVGFFEVHAENFMGEGGPPHRYLAAIRESYPLSIHGVGLSLGSAAALDERHLGRLRKLLARYEPRFFSEHLAWSSHGGTFLNDLLPVSYDRETLQRVCEHIDATQTCLKRRMLLENPSTYVGFTGSTFDEPRFITEIVQRTGCGLLLDVNNAYVSAINQQFDAHAYLDAYPLAHVEQIHLAGHAATCDPDGHPLLIDDHGSPVVDAVWDLYRTVIRRRGSIPTLIEWDSHVPELATLLAEATQADTIARAAITGAHQDQDHALLA